MVFSVFPYFALLSFPFLVQLYEIDLCSQILLRHFAISNTATKHAEIENRFWGNFIPHADFWTERSSKCNNIFSEENQIYLYQGKALHDQRIGKNLIGCLRWMNAVPENVLGGVGTSSWRLWIAQQWRCLHCPCPTTTSCCFHKTYR